MQIALTLLHLVHSQSFMPIHLSPLVLSLPSRAPPLRCSASSELGPVVQGQVRVILPLLLFLFNHSFNGGSAANIRHLGLLYVSAKL